MLGAPDLKGQVNSTAVSQRDQHQAVADALRLRHEQGRRDAVTTHEEWSNVIEQRFRHNRRHLQRIQQEIRDGIRDRFARFDVNTEMIRYYDPEQYA